ncbi:hypothetical protein GCM10009594_15100 [Kocuria palustris]
MLGGRFQQLVHCGAGMGFGHSAMGAQQLFDRLVRPALQWRGRAMQEVAGRAGQGGVQECEEVLVTDQRAEQAADSAQ